MAGQHVCSWRPEKHVVSPKRANSACRLGPPTQNKLIAALPEDDYRRLSVHLEPVSLPFGGTVIRGGERQRYLHFVTEGITSCYQLMENGKATGVAVTGNEGAIGVASFLGGVSMLSEALVLSAGFAYRLKADVVRDEFGHGGALPRLLLRYTAALMAQIGQTAICNRYHSVEQQFCRSILSCLDRVPLNELTITQHLIADMLGVRREGVTLAAGTLQAAGLIGWSRGRMVVLDRRRLEERVCECYAIDRGVHEHLIDSETAAGNAA